MRRFCWVMVTAACGATPAPISDGRPDCVRLGEGFEAQGKIAYAEDAYERGCNRDTVGCCEGQARMMKGRSPVAEIVKVYDEICTRWASGRLPAR